MAAAGYVPNSSNKCRVTAVASSATAVAILAANDGRRGFSVYNDSTAILYLSFDPGDEVTSSLFSVQLDTEEQYDSPAQPIWLGRVRGIWASANGNAMVTEYE